MPTGARGLPTLPLLRARRVLLLGQRTRGIRFRTGMRRSVARLRKQQAVRPVERFGEADSAGVSVIQIQVRLEEFFSASVFTAFKSGVSSHSISTQVMVHHERSP